jgi:hypothetical protein
MENTLKHYYIENPAYASNFITTSQIEKSIDFIGHFLLFWRSDKFRRIGRIFDMVEYNKR